MIIHRHATDDIQMLCLLLQIPSQQLVCVWGIDRKIKCAKATISGLCSILSSPRPNGSWPHPLWRLGTQPPKAQWYPPSNISSISFSDVERSVEGFDVGFLCTNFLWSTSREIGLTFSLSSLPSLSTKFLENFLMSSSLRRDSSSDGSFKSLFVGWWYCKELTCYFLNSYSYSDYI